MSTNENQSEIHNGILYTIVNEIWTNTKTGLEELIVRDVGHTPEPEEFHYLRNELLPTDTLSVITNNCSITRRKKDN